MRSCVRACGDGRGAVVPARPRRLRERASRGQVRRSYECTPLLPPQASLSSSILVQYFLLEHRDQLEWAMMLTQVRAHTRARRRVAPAWGSTSCVSGGACHALGGRASRSPLRCVPTIMLTSAPQVQPAAAPQPLDSAQQLDPYGPPASDTRKPRFWGRF